jgi:hypothetical protein
MKLTGFVFLLFMVIGAVIGAILWPWTINKWLVFAHKAPAVTWWQGALIGFVPYVGNLAIPIAFLT